MHLEMSDSLRPNGLLNCLCHLCLAQHVDARAHWILPVIQTVALQAALYPPPRLLPALASQLSGRSSSGTGSNNELARMACYQRLRIGCQEVTVITAEFYFHGM